MGSGHQLGTSLTPYHSPFLRKETLFIFQSVIQMSHSSWNYTWWLFPTRLSSHTYHASKRVQWVKSDAVAATAATASLLPLPPLLPRHCLPLSYFFKSKWRNAGNFQGWGRNSMATGYPAVPDQHTSLDRNWGYCSQTYSHLWSGGVPLHPWSNY